MKNLKIRKILLLTSTSIVLVGCQNNITNNYENKVIYTEETRDIENTTNEITTTAPETTTMEETTTAVPETTTKEQASASVETTTKMKDEEVIEYIQKIGDDMNDASENIADSVKSGFITVVDFLFYDGTIGGRTFDSLKDDTKSTVLGLYDSISTYVEEKWPTWKESFGEKYQDVKELWNEKKEDLSDLWQKGKQKIKNWYENFREENN